MMLDHPWQYTILPYCVIGHMRTGQRTIQGGSKKDSHGQVKTGILTQLMQPLLQLAIVQVLQFQQPIVENEERPCSPLIKEGNCRIDHTPLKGLESLQASRCEPPPVELYVPLIVCTFWSCGGPTHYVQSKACSLKGHGSHVDHSKLEYCHTYCMLTHSLPTQARDFIVLNFRSPSWNIRSNHAPHSPSQGEVATVGIYHTLHRVA